jgi:hypothetical protein
MTLALAMNDPKKLIEIDERREDDAIDPDAPGMKWWPSPEGQGA